MIKAYLAATRYTITNMADLVQMLKTNGLDDNTFVVLTADHGYEIGGPGDMLGKNSLLEAANKVLVAIRDAGQTVGSINEGMASTLDLYKTIVHATFGLQAAENFRDDMGPLQGNSLYPGINDKTYNANPLGVVTQYPRCQPRGTVQTLDCMTNANDDTCSLPAIQWMGYTIETTSERLTQWFPFNYASTNCTQPWWPNMPAATQQAAVNWPAWSQINPALTGTNWQATSVEQEYYPTLNFSLLAPNLAVKPTTHVEQQMAAMTNNLLASRGVKTLRM